MFWNNSTKGRGDIRYATFLGMGRTRSWAPTAPLVNQIGRYAVHFHHAIGPETAANDPFIHSVQKEFFFFKKEIDFLIVLKMIKINKL